MALKALKVDIPGLRPWMSTKMVCKRGWTSISPHGVETREVVRLPDVLTGRLLCHPHGATRTEREADEEEEEMTIVTIHSQIYRSSSTAP